MNIVAIDDKDIVLSLVWARLLRGDSSAETALSRVILHEVSEVVRRNDIADSDDLHILANDSLLDHRAKHETTNTTKAIDGHFHCHKNAPEEGGPRSR